MAGSNATGPRLCSSEAGQGQRVCTTRTGPSITRLSSVARGSLWLQLKPNAFRALQSEGRDLFKEHLVLFREGFSSFFSSSELSATDVFSSSSFSSLFISLVPEETLLRPSPPDKPAKEHKRLEGAGSLHSCGIISPSHPSVGGSPILLLPLHSHFTTHNFQSQSPPFPKQCSARGLTVPTARGAETCMMSQKPH